MRRLWLFLPLAALALILIIGGYGFQLEDPHRLPSALINKPFPEFSASALEAAEGLMVSREDLLDGPTLVNIWATWCPTCRAEHDLLTAIRKVSPVRIVGVNYKDDPQAAIAWLQQHGNPYDLVITDADGRLGVELGVYGAPETFLLDSAGIVRFKQVGAIDAQAWSQDLAPRLRALGVAAAPLDAHSDASDASVPPRQPG